MALAVGIHMAPGMQQRLQMKFFLGSYEISGERQMMNKHHKKCVYTNRNKICRTAEWESSIGSACFDGKSTSLGARQKSVAILFPAAYLVCDLVQVTLIFYPNFLICETKLLIPTLSRLCQVVSSSVLGSLGSLV